MGKPKLNILILICIFIISDITFATGISAVDPNTDFLIINYQGEHKSDKFAPVPFTHKKHYVDYEYACRACHHAWKLDIRENPVKCKECHKGKEESKAILLRNAFHRCCMNCHRDLRKAKKPTGPVGCKKCHFVAKKQKKRKIAN